MFDEREFSEVLDDEQGKGHGNRRSSAGPSSGRWTPTILSNMLRRAEGRFSPVSPFASSQSSVPHHPSSSFKPVSPRYANAVTNADDTKRHEELEVNRKTPAQYRPKDSPSTKPVFLDENCQPISDYYGSALHRHPLSHAHKMSVSTASNSSHSVQMSPGTVTHSRHASLHATPLQASPVVHTGSSMSSSPLIVPQARRGAVNLQPQARRKRTAAGRQQSPSHTTPIHIQAFQFLHLTFWALAHPFRTCASIQQTFLSTLYSIDTAFRDPRTGARVWKPVWLSAYVPLLIWLAISLSSTITVLIWHTQVFQALDRLSVYLQSLGLRGRLMLGSLIFLTTFPPLPLYSTLIILCGFSFGLVQGFIISYIAALSGAVTVFLLSRSLLRTWMVRLLNRSGGLKRVVRAIEKRPKLLFLVRLAPYPYNLMNTLLASSPTLTLKTYTLCTALALPKLLVHCGLGTTIKNFAAYNGATSNDAPTTDQGSPDDMAQASATAELIKHISGFVGVGLCIGIFIYLFRVARRAVDEELDDEYEAEAYEMVWSEEEDEEDKEVDGLEEDDLNIASHAASNDSLTDESSQRASSQGGNESRSMMHSAPRQAFHLSVRSGGDEGGTPLYMAPSAGTSDEAPTYFSWSACKDHTVGGNKLSAPHRYMESSVSLADSIAEMEKHATLMESETSGCEDISISLDSSPTRNIQSLSTTLTNSPTSFNTEVMDHEDDEYKRVVALNRDRASRRSQGGYEETLIEHS